MSVNVRIRNGLCPDPTTGEGGATEGDIRGSFSDIIDVIGVKDLAGGHCAVTQNSPAAMSVLVAPGVVYIPNADYDELDSNEPKFYEAIIDAEDEVTITANTSGSTRIDLICVKIDKTITPDEHASNIATLVAVAGTPGAGAPTLPDNYAKLAEVEVANGASTIVNADITDSRVQAKINSDYIGASVSVTTKGDLQTHNGTTPARLAVGTDGQKLIADSNQTNGLLWKTEDGWNSAFETWEYVSVDDPTGVIKVNADVTTKYSVGMRIKMTNGGHTIFGIITKVGTYGGDSAGYTYITFLHEIDPSDNLALYLMANSAITNNYYSTAKAPQGFPQDITHWKIKVEDANNRTTTPTKDAWYNPNNISLSVPIGRWKLGYFVGHRCSATTTGHYMSFVSLATSNNAPGDNDFKKMHGNNPGFSTGTSYTLGIGSAEKIINNTSKTTYYLNHMCATAGTLTNECGFYGQWDVATTIYAICDYL